MQGSGHRAGCARREPACRGHGKTGSAKSYTLTDTRKPPAQVKDELCETSPARPLDGVGLATAPALTRLADGGGECGIRPVAEIEPDGVSVWSDAQLGSMLQAVREVEEAAV